MGRFQYGVCEWSLTARGAALCELAAGQKLDCLQLGVGEETLRGEGLGNESIVQEYLRASEQNGVKITSLSPQFVDQYSFTRPQGSEEEEIAIRLVEYTIELCTVFGCDSFLLPVLGKNGIFDGPSFHRAADYIRRFSEEAGKKGISTYLEINQSVEQLHNLLDAVDNPMVRIFFDSQNLYVYDGTSMARYFTAIEELVGGVHLKDGVGTMLSGSLLGEGTSGFQRTAEAILRSSYSGPLILESVYNKPTVSSLGTEEELLARDVATLHSVFDEKAYA